MIKFEYISEQNGRFTGTKLRERNVEYTLTGDDFVIDELIAAFGDFLKGLGFSPETIDENLLFDESRAYQ
jgi:hypothetical protein